MTIAQAFEAMVRNGIAGGLRRSEARAVARHLVQAYDVFEVDPETGAAHIRFGVDLFDCPARTPMNAPNPHEGTN